MGRFNQKIRRNGQQSYEGRTLQDAAVLEGKIREQLRDKKYGAVLETLVELLESTGKASPDAFYAGAYAYFMQGDYHRAGEWVNNTLSYAPRHVAARILLARFCILEDRTAEALAVLDVLLEKGRDQLTEEERSEIREIAGYYGRTRKDMICRDYPYIADFLQLSGETPTLQAAPPTVEQGTAGHAGAEDDALALARQKLEEINGMQCSVKEKVHILCTFAGGWYYEGKLEAARRVLEGALLLDSGDGAVLRGLSLVAAESGDMDKALRYAAAIRPTDFVLLGLLREFA